TRGGDDDVDACALQQRIELLGVKRRLQRRRDQRSIDKSGQRRQAYEKPNPRAATEATSTCSTRPVAPSRPKAPPPAPAPRPGLADKRRRDVEPLLPHDPFGSRGIAAPLLDCDRPRGASIEALNRQLRKAIKTKGHFPNEEAARKLIYLAITKAVPAW